jgi:ParB family chromosome partitioning protein
MVRVQVERQLWEIDENLMRAELTELEKAEHLVRRKDIYVARYPETRQGQGNSSKRQLNDNLSFSQDTAEKLGIDKRTIERAVRRAQRIDPEVKDRIATTPNLLLYRAIVRK